MRVNVAYLIPGFDRQNRSFRLLKWFMHDRSDRTLTVTRNFENPWATFAALLTKRQKKTSTFHKLYSMARSRLATFSKTISWILSISLSMSLPRSLTGCIRAHLRSFTHRFIRSRKTFATAFIVSNDEKRVPVRYGAYQLLRWSETFITEEPTRSDDLLTELSWQVENT